MVKISSARTDLENARLEQAVLKDYGESVSTVTSTTTTTLDISNGNVFFLNHTTNITTLTISNPASSGTATTITIVRKKDQSLFTRTITWPSSFVWTGGSEPTLTQQPNQVDVITAVTRDGGATWLASAVLAFSPDPGSLFAWGTSGNGQLGDSTTVTRSSPVQVGTLVNWSVVAPGFQHVIAIKTDSTLWAWGNAGSTGRLGDSTTVAKSSPVQIGTLATWTIVATGAYQAVALQTNGTLWAWGNNSNGRVGDSSTLNRSSPVQIGTLATWTTAAEGNAHAVALRSNGTLWAWGHAGTGNLGDSTTADKSSPVQIGTLATWGAVGAGNGRTFAVRTNGALWAWGYGGLGAIGDSTTTTRSSPVQIGTLTDWASVVGGRYATFALKTNGTLWAWGYGGNGNLGDGTNITRSSPVQVGTLGSWVSVAQGNRHTVGVQTNGTLWSWGLASSGRLGDGQTAASRSSPTQIGTLSTWGGVAANYTHSFGLRV